jgi:hypothetical protein
MLLEGGRDDIKLPRDHAREMRSEYFGDGSELNRRFEWVDTLQHPNFIELKENAYSYIERLKTSGLSLGTINGKATAVNNFFRYVLKKFPFYSFVKITILQYIPRALKGKDTDLSLTLLIDSTVMSSKVNQPIPK